MTNEKWKYSGRITIPHLHAGGGTIRQKCSCRAKLCQIKIALSACQLFNLSTKREGGQRIE